MLELDNWHARRFLFGYFSLVTLTTMGYGDITPALSRRRVALLAGGGLRPVLHGGGGGPTGGHSHRAANQRERVFVQGKTMSAHLSVILSVVGVYTLLALPQFFLPKLFL